MVEKSDIFDGMQNYALVTGASSGLGRYLSGELVGKGYNLIAVSNQPEGLEELKKELEETNNITIITINMDLAENNAAKSLFDFCEKNKYQVDVLVNNAGILVFGEVTGIPFDRTESILHLHMTTPALLCRLFGEKMKTKGHGHILNVSSISAVMPYPTISLYGPTKSFLRHFSRALRTELKPEGINVTCLLPGAMDTNLLREYNFNVKKARKVRVLKQPDKVAMRAMEALFKRRSECIPGTLNKLTIYLLPFVPQYVIGLIYRRSRHIT